MKTKPFLFRNLLAQIAIAICLLHPIPSTAATITKNYTFSSGQTASASAVNSNFDQLFSKVNSLDSSSWSTNGTSYYYTGGNVGFGTSSPLANIHSSVSRSQTNFGGGATPLAIFENPDTSQGQAATRLSIYNNNNNVNGTLITQEYYTGAIWSTNEQANVFIGKWGGALGMNDRDVLNGGNGIKALTWAEGIAGEGTVFINAGIHPGVPSNLMVNGGTAMGSYAGTSSAPANGLIVSGSVGIGDDTPGFKLDVNGTIRGFGITDSSDMRLKKRREHTERRLREDRAARGREFLLARQGNRSRETDRTDRPRGGKDLSRAGETRRKRRQISELFPSRGAID